MKLNSTRKGNEEEKVRVFYKYTHLPVLELIKKLAPSYFDQPLRMFLPACNILGASVTFHFLLTQKESTTNP